MKEKLQKYIDELEKDIDRLQNKDLDYIRNIMNESDARLLGDVKEDLMKILGGSEDDNK